MANWWESAPLASPLDIGLHQEGITGPLADIARSVYAQESSSGRNTSTSNAGAVGGMQILPGTFAEVADEGWDINDPVQNARAGIRYLNKMYELGGNDPRLAAIGYYGGPGAIQAARAGQSRSDPRNPQAPDTFQYADQVLARIPREPGMIERAVNAVIPTAQAETVPAENWWEQAELVSPAPQARQDQKWWEAAPLVESGPQEQVQPEAWQQDSALAAIGAGLGAGVGQVVLGAQNYLGQGLQAAGAESIGNWLVEDAKQGKDRLQNQLQPYREESPIAAGGGVLAGNIAATYPVGGGLARLLRMVSPYLGVGSVAANRLAQSVATGGLRVGATPQTSAVGNALYRAAGGGATGTVTAGLVDQDDAATGGLVGAAFPIAGRALGGISQATGRALRGGEISQPVRALAERAAELGIQIPADRIANSRSLNAVASGLNYVPFSGRSAVEDRMQDQLNRAITRTFGQDSVNVTKALRQASSSLGKKFDDVLQSTTVRVDDHLLDDLAAASERAARELGTEQAGIIQRQIDEIISKGASGGIDGQAAYNIKRTLDRIGRRTTPEAFYADDLRRNLMDALNRSLGPEAAQAFAQTRRQYGNMLSLERLAQNGAEGDISIARLANMKNIRSRDLQELADIAAQFLRPRESQHSAAQRAFAGIGAGIVGGPTALLGGVAAGRGMNMLLDSNVARNSVMAQRGQALPIENALTRLALPAYRSAPVISAQ